MRLFLVLLSLGLLIGCETMTPTEYPLSEETCAPGDPVQDMSSNDCVLPVTGL
ncbi:hypothetical protein [Celeribacter neptunius]|uniref:Lipoprotein n=1 Tax=Celeribacter neptunius TaxID=588602 RepID=A0A1I3JJT7_9RHOB|nr:hypothetical protein [Celeribacter neptunius]SFI60511.1 hypothetical protein SAMN04487991_0377 [Celeribacter neptunius]